MISISLCMIVKNEEDVIRRCLESIVDLVDETIIVDTGSTDRTKEYAALYTDQIFDFEWIDDFAAARNYAFSLASSDYCMWLDADDIMLSEDRIKFLQLKSETDSKTNVVMMKYNTGFDEKGNVTFSYYRERIIKRNAGMIWQGAIHEVIAAFGETTYSDCAVTHRKLHPSDPNRNLNIFEKMIAKNIALDARQKFYYGRELYYHSRYEDAICVFENFLEEPDAWLENKIDACMHCSYCYYQLGQEKKALLSLLFSLTLDIPRAEICCDIGKHFLDRDQFLLAIHWYEQALTCRRDDIRGGFVSSDSYDYIPCIQLCVCYSKIGKFKKAIEFNQMAAAHKPDSEAVSYNFKYFSSLSS